MSLKRTSLYVCCSVLLSACNTANLKQNIGTGVGAVLGAGIGNKLCENSDKRELCTVMGTLAGAYIGNMIGKRLDERDRERHAKATQDVLLAQNDNASASWENQQNGTSGKVKVIEQSSVNKRSSIPVYKDKVEQVPPLELIDQVYTTNRTVNVRVGPGTDFKKAPPSLQPGEKFDVIGKVIAQPEWLMIEKDGIGSGFVFAGLVQPMGLISTPKTVNSADARVAVVETDTVGHCKTVQHEITYDDGKVEQDTVQMCQQDDGSWTLA